MILFVESFSYDTVIKLNFSISVLMLFLIIINGNFGFIGVCVFYWRFLVVLGGGLWSYRWVRKFPPSGEYRGHSGLHSKTK